MNKDSGLTPTITEESQGQLQPHEARSTKRAPHRSASKGNALEGSKEFSFSDLFRVIKRRLLLIVVSMITVLGLAMAYYMSASPIYRARSRIKIEEIDPILTTERLKQRRGGTQTESYIQTKLTELKNLPLANRVLSNGEVRELFALHYNLEIRSETEEEYSHSPSLLRKYLSLISVEPVAETSIVSVYANTLSPELSKLVADTHSREFIKLLKQERKEADRDVKEFLVSQEKELREKLSSSEKALSKYAETHGIIDLGSQDTAALRYEEVQKLLRQAEADTMKKKSAYKKVKAFHEAGSTVAEDSTIATIRGELSRAETRYKKLSQKYAPGYPALRELRAEISALKQQIVTERGASVISARAAYEAAQEYESDLRKQMKKEQEIASAMSVFMGEYERLKQDHESLKKVYDDIVNQLRQVEVGSRSGSGLNVTLVEPASVPGSPASPKLHLLLLFAGFVGAALGLGLALLREFLDVTVKDPEEAENYLGLPGLAILPHFDDFTSEKRNPFARSGYRNSKATLPVQTTGFISVDRPFTAHGEAFRDLRAAIRLSSIDSKVQTVLVTSSSPSEGKSTVAANLAAAFAMDGFRTILLDADLRKPTLQAFFPEAGSESAAGLTELLSNQISIQECQHESVKVKNLSFIGAGGACPNPAELAGSRKMEELLDTLRSEFEFIVIDSPPVGVVSDATMVAPCCDGVILVTRENLTHKRTLLKAVARLEAANSRLLGFVYNGLRIQRGFVGRLKKRTNYNPVYGTRSAKALLETSKGDDDSNKAA